MCTTETERGGSLDLKHPLTVDFCYTPWFCFPKRLSRSETGKGGPCSSLLPFLRSVDQKSKMERRRWEVKTSVPSLEFLLWASGTSAARISSSSTCRQLFLSHWCRCSL